MNGYEDFMRKGLQSKCWCSYTEMLDNHQHTVAASPN